MPLNMNPWIRYKITLGFLNEVVGGIPTDPELIKGWVKANMPDATAEEREKLAAKTAAELPQATEDKAEGMWTTFKKDDKGIYIEGRQIKSMFKEVANIVRDYLIKGEKKDIKKEEKVEEEEDDKKSKKVAAVKSRFTNLKAKVAERLFVEDQIVYLMRKGKHLPKPDGTEEKAIHVMTAQGPRSALKRVDYVDKPEITFTVRLFDDGLVDLELVRFFLEFGGWNGLGANRSQGNGLFQVVEVTPL